MNEQESASLLQRYVRDRDEDSFREIVGRYIGLVESAALRSLNNDAAAARDVTQIVFTDLARQAPRLSSGALLGSWLYKHTCFVASKFVRSEQRRRAREKEASQMLTNDPEADWAEVAPHLDSAILELSADDQNAIILRFFERRNLRAIGEVLKISDDAAQKRVQRALEKLREALQAKGVSVGVSTLSAMLLAKGISSATAASVGAIAAAAFAGSAATSFVTAITTTVMSKTGILLAGMCLSGIVAVALLRKEPAKAAAALASAQRPKRPEAVEKLTTIAPTQSAPPARSQDAPAPNSIDEFLERFQKDLRGDEDKIKEALFAFWNRYDAATQQEQFQLRQAIPAIIGLWKDASMDSKKTIIGTLQRFRPSEDRIVDIYLEAYDTPEIQTQAIGAIMFAGPLAARATDRLIDQLQRNHGVNDRQFPGDTNARMALEALANFGPAAAAAAPMLKGYFSDTNMLYRVIGAKAYWNITGDADTVLPVLTKALVEERSFWAADILATMGAAAAPALEELERAYASSSNPSARLSAYEAIREIDRSRAPNPEGLIELLEKGNDISQMHAARLLWNDFKNPEQIVGTLAKLVTDRLHGNPSTQIAPALNLLAEIGPPAESALPKIKQVLESRVGDSRSLIAATNAWRAIAPDRPIPSRGKM
jgi:RNA polymerase sigma factor (sigma-70 family)